MAKDKNGKEIGVGDEIVLVLRVVEIVPRGGDVAVVRAVGVHGESAKQRTPWEIPLYPDQVIVQRPAATIKPKGCPVRGCGQPMPHGHSLVETADVVLLESASTRPDPA